MTNKKPARVSNFYADPTVSEAKNFAADFRDLSIRNMTEVGHRFRLMQGDPTAEQIEAERDGGPIPERINWEPDFLPAVFLEQGFQRSCAICLIETGGTDFEGRTGEWCGTGFLMPDNLLLTNHHVINSIEVARSAVCIFNFQDGVDQRPPDTVAFKLNPDRLFVTSPYKEGLDYTIVAIEEAASQQFGFIPLKRSAFTVHVGDRANIVQHPQGRRKEVVLHNNEVLEDTGILLHYVTDTEVGSSGSPVFNNRWELIALHHAGDRNVNKLTVVDNRPAPKYINEGIKTSAIAADLERRAASGEEGKGPREALKTFTGVDSLMGYFGGLGRHPVPPNGEDRVPGIERVVSVYNGEAQDIDVAFWNVEWFTNRYQEKVGSVAGIIADLNLDVWALSESSPEATEALVEQLRRDFSLDFGAAFSEPNSSAGKQSTTVIWNKATVEGERIAWPTEIEQWFQVDSRQFDQLRLEAVHGKVFDRYPGLFRFRAKNRESAEPFDFFLVPLHLKAKEEGALRRRMAAKILGTAIKKMIGQGHDGDWIVGGDFNAELATTDFRDLMSTEMTPLSAADEEQGAMSYLKSPKSLIDHIFLSPNLVRTFGADDFFIIASERQIPDYIRRISDHRPVLIRLSLADYVAGVKPLPPSLVEALALR